MNPDFKTINVVRTAALGDAVQMTPMLRQIRADMPGAHIRCFTSPNSVDLFQGAPFVDEIIGLPTEWISRAAEKFGLIEAWLEVARHGRSDALISLEPKLRRNLGAWMCRSKRKAGLVFEGTPPLHPFTHPLRCSGDPKTAVIHTSELYLHLWTKLSGCADRGFGYDMRHLIERGADVTLPAPPYVCLAPGAGNAWVDLRTKRWPTAHYIELGRLLMANGFQVAYIGGQRDLDELGVPAGAVDLLGKTTLPQVTHLLVHAAAMFGNDSGLYHLAIGVDCPAVAAFGPTDEKLTGPFRTTNARVLRRDIPCAPCYAAECAPPPKVAAAGHARPCCLHAVTPMEALRALQELAGAAAMRKGRNAAADPVLAA